MGLFNDIIFSLGFAAVGMSVVLLVLIFYVLSMIVIARFFSEKKQDNMHKLQSNHMLPPDLQTDEIAYIASAAIGIYFLKAKEQKEEQIPLFINEPENLQEWGKWS